MPKVRCSGCQSVLNAPDSAAGKLLTCPKCQTKIKIPGGKPATAKAEKQTATAPLAATAFDKLDLDKLQSEDEEDQVCPYCAAELDPEDPICRSCGMNVELGVMDAKEAKRRAIKGPDPALFYKEVWSDSWAFLKEFKGLAFRTGGIWLLFATIFAICAYMGLIFCKTPPTKTFWIGLAFIAFLGLPGWFMYLGSIIVKSTVFREQIRSDRIFFDYFQSVAGGLRLLFWPFVVMGPLTPSMFGILAGFSEAGVPMLPLGIAAWFTWGVLPALLLPLAFVHMTAKYTYKAWILWELLKVGVKNIGAILYLYILAFVAILPLCTVALPLWLIMKDGNPFTTGPISDWFGGVSLWLMKAMELNDEPDYWLNLLTKAVMEATSLFLLLTPFFLMSGFSAVYIMRAIGLFGYYNNNSLDLVQRMIPGTPATFWVRYLAHSIDYLFIPFTGFLVTGYPKLLIGLWCVYAMCGLYVVVMPMLVPPCALLALVYTHWLYWVGHESSSMKATLGKYSFGLLVEHWDEQPMTLKQASLKWFLRCTFSMNGCVPFLGAAFHPEKKSLHDIMTRSRVFWKGDK